MTTLRESYLYHLWTVLCAVYYDSGVHRCLAALGRKDESLAALERLIGHQSDGLREYLRQQGEKDFPSLWGDPQFDRLIHV